MCAFCCHHLRHSDFHKTPEKKKPLKAGTGLLQLSPRAVTVEKGVCVAEHVTSWHSGSRKSTNAHVLIFLLLLHLVPPEPSAYGRCCQQAELEFPLS